jgi:molybdopterin/thiamine biosynthesis adenylyltransferase
MTVEAAADRYARQRVIPGWDQGRLTTATAVVIGVGALGNEVAKNLALAGVGRLILCDPDVISVSNLSRTVLLGAGDVGRAKVTVAAGALRRLAPGVAVEPRVADLARGVGLGELADAGVVLGCVDSIRARMRLLGRCALVGAPLIDGGTHPHGGEVRLRLSTQEPCFGCTLTPHERGVADLPWSCFGTNSGGPQPATIATTALVASWMSLLAVNLTFGERPPYRALRIEAATGHTAPVVFERDPKCPFHRPLAGPVGAVPVTSRATVGEFLAALDPTDEPLTWEEFPLPRRCRECGQHAGTAAAREGGDTEARVLRCGHCGALVRATLTQRIRAAGSELRLSDLGVAPEEILPVRTHGGEYRCRRMKR